MPITPQEMRLFAAECLRWADETDNASHRELMIRIARTWVHTATALDRHIAKGDEVLPDLRVKLD